MNEWESYLEAITLQVDGLEDDLVLPGPTHASNAQTDLTEPYGFPDSWGYPTARADSVADWLSDGRPKPVIPVHSQSSNRARNQNRDCNSIWRQ